jgi:hypothetical protein
MRIKANLPNLGAINYMTDPKSIARKLFEISMISMYSQSTTYFTNISSLPYALFVGGDDLNKIKSNVEDMLFNLFSRYFESVRVQVDAVEEGPDSANATINIALVYGDGDESKTLEESLDINSGVIDLSNFGIFNRRDG